MTRRFFTHTVVSTLIFASLITPMRASAVVPSLAISGAIAAGADAAAGLTPAGAPGLPVNDIGANLKLFALNLKQSAQAAKELSLDGLGWFAANQLIHQMTRATINWINNGFEGSPGFVTDPAGFFADVADQVSGKFLEDIKADKLLCAPFSLQIRLALVNGARRTSRPRYSCTLGSVVQNAEAFLSDFKQGGWKGWISLSQEENSPYLSYLGQKELMGIAVTSQINGKSQELEWGRGFLSMRDPRDPSKIVTPGAAIQHQLESALDLPADKLVVADEFDELIGALVGQLANKVLSGAGGLLGSSRPADSGGASLLDRVSVDINREGERVRGTVADLISEDISREKNYLSFKEGSLSSLKSMEADLTDLQACITGNASVNSDPQATVGTQNFTTSVTSLPTGSVNVVPLSAQREQIASNLETLKTLIPLFTDQALVSRTMIVSLTKLADRARATVSPSETVEISSEHQSIRANLHDETDFNRARAEFDEYQKAAAATRAERQSNQNQCRR